MKLSKIQTLVREAIREEMGSNVDEFVKAEVKRLIRKQATTALKEVTEAPARKRSASKKATVKRARRVVTPTENEELGVENEEEN